MTNKIPVTEKDFAAQVEQLLEMFGWVWCHFRPARTKNGWVTALSGFPGFPDYFAVKDGKILIFELKSERGKVTVYQELWHSELKKCGQEVYVWRPVDIEMIAEILRRYR